MALGVIVTTSTAVPPHGVPTATDTWFVAGVTTVGTEGVPEEIRNMPSFETKFGTRSASGNQALWDALEVFFREGGKRAMVVRGATGALNAALDTFTEGMGPGQVSAIGYPIAADGATAISLWEHARKYNRIAICQALNSATTPAAQETYIQTVDDDADGYGGFFGWDVIVPPPTGVSGASARTLSPVSSIAALCARVDATGNPNQAAAGRWVPLQYVTDLVKDPNMTDREALLDVGLNTLANIYGVYENYGFQTPVPQGTDNPFWQLNCSRTRMAIVANAKAIGEDYMFRSIDGQGILAGALKGNLDGMLMSLYQAGALYGATPADAFRVDTGPGVNTVESVSQGLLKAHATVVLSLHAKAIEIELVSVPVGGSV